MVNPYYIVVVLISSFIIAMILLEKSTEIKIVMWKLGLYSDKCPRCGATFPDWMEHSHGKDGFSGKYWCDNCGLWKEEKNV